MPGTPTSSPVSILAVWPGGAAGAGFDLRKDGQPRGSYDDGADSIVAFARTLGYQE